MADFATTADVEARWRPLSATELVMCAALLEDASAMIRAQFPNAMFLDVALTRLACVNMVLRVLKNPDGARSETIGPYTQTFGSQMAGALMVTAAETALLTPPSVSTSRPAGSIRLRAGLMSPTLEADIASREITEWELIDDAW